MARRRGDDAPPIALRVAGAVDAAPIARVHCAAALAGYADIFPPEATKPTPESLRSGWEELLDDPRTEVAVATSGEGATAPVIGSVAVTAASSVPSGLLLTRLYVEPARWGSGVGSRLHEWALTAARERGATSLNLWVLEANGRARAMYERRGWRLVPGWTLPNDPPTIHDVLYERTLADR